MTNEIHPTKPPRRAIWPWVIAAIFGLVLGVSSAWAVSGGALGYGKVKVGRWSSDPSVGAQAAHPWLRARIARVGLLALTKTETLYFDRMTDESGAPLLEACVYRLSGGVLPTRWWSMTIYGADQFLPRNTDGASSVDATRTLQNGATTWEGVLSAVRPEGVTNWLSSKGGGTFSITLRLYNPQSVDPAELAKIAFPKIEKQSCGTPTVGGVKP